MTPRAQRPRLPLPALAAVFLLLGGCPSPGDPPAALDPGVLSVTQDMRAMQDMAARQDPGAARDPASVQDPFPTLAADRICPSSGYLCEFLLAPGRPGRPGRDESGPAASGRGAGAPDPGVRVARWPDGTGVLRIRVEPPPVSDAEEARELQRAAVRGLLAWDGQPFRLQIQDRDTGGGPSPHVHVAWREHLGPGQAGRVTTRWELRGTAFRFEVVSFELALEVPPEGGGAARPLAPDDVERVAAHEMGHALGLGHSDAPEDLMYPLNTARALSPRDYRTMEALYRLPAGARVVGSARP
jgi:hypothetical protein